MILLRTAEPGDAGTIARHRYPGETGEHLGVYAAWLPGVMSDGRYLGWLAEQGGQVIGGAGLTLLHWGPGRGNPNPWRGRVVNVYVEPEVRRQGVARQLMAAVLLAAHDRQLPVLSLGATPEARELYASVGFHPSETEMWRRTD